MSAGWLGCRWLALDFETTGIDVETDRIVAAYAGLISGGEDVDATTWLIDPGIEIPGQASKIHGITTEHAREHGIPAVEGVAQIAAKVSVALAAGIPVVGWNVGTYDLTLLDNECRRYALNTLAERIGGPVCPVIDGIVLDRECDPRRRKTVASRRLVDAARHYGVDLSEIDAHGAEADALAAARTVWKIARKYPQLAEFSIMGLHQAQVEWAAGQQASLEKFLRRKDPAAVVERGWPLRQVAS